MKRTGRILPAILTAILGWMPVCGIDRAAVRAELEAMEDLRILHRFAVQNLHDSMALSIYLSAWGGPDMSAAVEDGFVETEALYDVLHAVDHGATALQAALDAGMTNGLSDRKIDILRRARGEAAERTRAHYALTAALKELLVSNVTATAAGKAKWVVASEQAQWEDPAREAERLAGIRFSRLADETFFRMPPEQRDALLLKNRRMGYSALDVIWDPASNWGDIEKEKGIYDFAALDSAMEQAGRHGMSVLLMLKTLTGTPPSWHREQHGSNCQFIVVTKEKGGWKTSAQGINLMHDPTCAAASSFLSALTDHLRTRWTGVVEAVSVEGGQREIEAVPDESEAMSGFWRRWSGTEEPWRSPEAIEAQEPFDEAAWVKAERCREAWLLEYARRSREAIKSRWPELPVLIPWASDDFHRMFASAVGRSRDVFALRSLTDRPGNASDSPAAISLARSVAGGAPLWQAGLHSGCGLTPLAASLHSPFYGASRITAGPVRWGIRADFPASWFRYSDWQIGDFGIGSYMMGVRLAQEMGPTLLSTDLTPASIALLWSQTSMRRDRTREEWQSALAFGHMLSRTGFRYDYVPETDLRERLKSYRVLVLPECRSLGSGTADEIRSWVADGGILFAFGQPGLYDETGRRREGTPLADVLGGDIAAQRTPAPITPDRLFTGHPEGAFLGPPPLPFMFSSNLTAAIRPTTGKARAWFAGGDVAIVENAFGRGFALWCGASIGALYRESAPYEFAYGLSHERTLSYVEEQKQYEQWIAGELSKKGIFPDAAAVSGVFLRAQLRDDGDWYHHTVNGPRYREYHLEEDRPARTVYALTRIRDGIDNIYVCALNTEANYFWERGYFRSTMGGGKTVISVALPSVAQMSNNVPLAWDIRLGVPVPLARKGDRWELATWLPAAQGRVFAVAPAGSVRLFGSPAPRGEGPAVLFSRTASLTGAATLPEVAFTDEPADIAAYLREKKESGVTIAYGEPGYRRAAQSLGAWLLAKHGIKCKLTAAPRRTVIRKGYMDGFGWNRVMPEPCGADILIGNTQDNPMMLRFVLFAGEAAWLPVGVNENFPGPGRAIIMLSYPIATEAPARARIQPNSRQLVIGASSPAEAEKAVKHLAEGRELRRL